MGVVNEQKGRIVAVLLGATLLMPFAIVSHRLCSGTGIVNPELIRDPSPTSHRNLMSAGGWIQLGESIKGDEGGQEGDILGGQVLLSSDGNRLAVWTVNTRFFERGGRYTLLDWNESTETWEQVFNVSGTYLSMSGDGSRIIVGYPEYDFPREDGDDDEYDDYLDEEYFDDDYVYDDYHYLSYDDDDDYDGEYYEEELEEEYGYEEELRNERYDDGGELPYDDDYEYLDEEYLDEEYLDDDYVDDDYLSYDDDDDYDGEYYEEELEEEYGYEEELRNERYDDGGELPYDDDYEYLDEEYLDEEYLDDCYVDDDYLSYDDDDDYDGEYYEAYEEELEEEYGYEEELRHERYDDVDYEYDGDEYEPYDDDDNPYKELEEAYEELEQEYEERSEKVNELEEQFRNERYEHRDSGYLTIYDWDGTTYKSMATITGTFAYQQMGFAAQISDDGKRFITVVYDNGDAKVEVYDLIGGSWELTSRIDVSSRNVHLSRDGKRIAVTAEPGLAFFPDTSSSEVHIYKETGSSWSQVGPKLDGLFLAMSSKGDHIVTGTITFPSGSVFIRSFRLVGAFWEQSGEIVIGASDISSHFGVDAAVSSDGRRLVLGFSGRLGPSRILGKARMYDFDGSLWIQRGDDITSDIVDAFASRVSIAGDGELVAIGEPFYDAGNGLLRNSGRVTVFQFQSKANDGPFPDNFQEVTCAYTSCLDSLISTYGTRTNFGDGQDAYDVSRLKVVGTQSTMKKGKVAASLRFLRSALKWTEILGDTAPSFSKTIGKQASACAVELVENFIGAYENTDILDKSFLEDVIKPKLATAKAEKASKKWKESVINSNVAVWKIMNELDEKFVPLCEG